jgi:uncharacterized protein YgbK (DUF1537 family)
VIASSALAYERGREQQAAAGLARLALCVMERFPAAGLVLTGGDIAAAVCSALSCGVIDLGGDILPGMPWGRLEGGRISGQMVVTKAGGFGDEDALLAAVRWLSGQQD